MKILVAVDGSPIATRAARYAGRLAMALAEAPRLVLVHVDAPLLAAAVRRMGRRNVATYHEENATYAMRSATAALRRLHVAFETQCVVGEAAQQIVAAAVDGKFDLVVMGSHGRGTFSSLFLGSVVTKVLSHSRIPVTVVR